MKRKRTRQDLQNLKTYIDNPSKSRYARIIEENEAVVEELRSYFDEGIITAKEFNTALDGIIHCTSVLKSWEEDDDVGFFVWDLRGHLEYHYDWIGATPREVLNKVKEFETMYVSQKDSPRYELKHYQQPKLEHKHRSPNGTSMYRMRPPENQTD